MDFRRSFRLSSYLLLLAGFGALFASGAVIWPVALLYALLVAAAWKRPIHYPDWAQLLLFVVLILLFLVDALTFSDFVSATVHLLIVVSLIKLFTLRERRDYLILYFISFGFLLFASAYTLSIAFLLALVVYVFVAILTFILFESKTAYEENRTAPFRLSSYLGVALLITTLIVVVSVPIFLVIPRVSFGLLRVDRRLDLNMSGFSNQVSLGDIGEIITNSRVVMRVRVDKPQEEVPLNLKWRGIALDRYDGHKWTNTRYGFERLRSGDRFRGYLVSRHRRSRERLLRQSFIADPFSNMIFGAPQIILISGDAVRHSPLFRDGNGSVGLYRRGRGLVRYVVDSDLVTRAEKLKRPVEGSIPETIGRRYLQLPAINPRIRQLARDVTRDFENDVQRSLALERYLKSTYAYSLANVSARAPDPLYDFLFVTRAGHCEFYATAQAVMMRVLGIPSRIVNGFHRGEYNRFSDYFVVRQSDAHSWVEGYFPGIGWVEFDPTPAAGDSRHDLSLAQLFWQAIDAVDIFWTELITFDRIKQVGFFRSLRASLQEAWHNLSSASSRLGEVAGMHWFRRMAAWRFAGLATLGVLLLLAVAAWLVYRYRRYLGLFWRRRVLGQRGSQLAPVYYLEMLDVLRRRGMEKHPAETPAEFAARIEPDLKSRLPAAITEIYYGNRFGGLPIEEARLGQIYSWLRELRG